VPKGANLTIYCLLATLERWRNAHGGNFPEEMYVQIDGGSENANQYVLAVCELLIAKRLVRRIELSRLPKGHTHEDIDAQFAHVWTWMRKRIISTVDEFGLLAYSARRDGFTPS
jgi:hypothetical protein